MQRNTLAALIASLFTLPVQAQDIPTLDEIIVTATRIPTPDIDAPYASEVHTRRKIEQSGAVTLYDYLAQYSSVQILPSYGNKFTPKLDMRGYGIGDGYQNIVVSVDGRRMNNIDMVGQLIGSIPLADIERIEITKGSGSVLFGDGATAGSIQIITRAHSGVSVQAALGNAGEYNATVTAGLKNEKVGLSLSADTTHTDGHAAPDIAGYKDASSNRTWRGGLELRPTAALKMGLDLASTRINTRYVGALTQAEFNADPAQNSGNTYTPQIFESDLWRVHAGLNLDRNWNILASHGQEDKLSEYRNGWGASNYDYRSDDLALQYRGRDFDLDVGAQTFNGTRIGASNRTRKINMGWYAQGQYRFGATTLSAGARAENVEYTYTPNAGATLKADHDLNAWDIGVNHRLNDRLNLFANYNRAFQAPDIDRFFNWGGTFNSFIEPAISRTLNLGLNHITPSNRLKVSLFHTNLNNEIYYYKQAWPLPSRNTNLDKTHKYGLELQDTWRAGESFSVNLNYTYARARIDQENEGAGAYNGKDLPGVPRHSANLGFAYRLSAESSVNLSHTWRGSAHAADDFANTLSQKQAAYQSTDLAYRYRSGRFEVFASVENLFEHKNGLWITQDAIYPINFTRNWRLGMKAAF